MTVAGLCAADVQYLECHGTGTPLGDPIEVQAAAAVLGEGRAPNEPLWLGSVKSNLGHTEGAAGVTGLIKVVLSLQHRKIPRNLHFKEPNPHIPWSELPVKVVTEAMDWPGRGPRVAGVSSFGFSGTNAHVVLEQAPEVTAVEAAVASVEPTRAELVVVSGKSESSVEQGLIRLREHLRSHVGLSLRDVAYSLATTRTHHEHRVAFAVSTRSQLMEGLEALGGGESGGNIGRGRVTAGRRGVVFVFPGQGSQWVGMGRQLIEDEKAFREEMEKCDRAILAESGWSVIEELRAPPERSKLGEIEVVQPALFAVGVSLAALWRSWGVEPEVVVGHSQGEVAAAYVAGALTLEDAVAIICRRSGLLRRITGRGEMALVQLSAEEARSAIAGHEGELSIAVINSRRSTVLSGSTTAMATVLGELEARGVYCKRVKASVAGHSPQADGILSELIEALSGIVAREPSIRMQSTVTTEVVRGGELNASYWADNLRKPVRFAEGVEGLLGEGYGVFLEISAHPLLVPALEELCEGRGGNGVVLSSLQRGAPERRSMLESLGRLYVTGCGVDWKGVFESGGRRVELPTYAWQRQRYWLESSPSRAGSGEETGHPLLGARVSVAGVEGVYEARVSRSTHGWLYEHRVGGQAWVPGAGLAELLRAAGEHRYEGESAEVSSLVIQAPLVLPEHGSQRVQVVLSEEGERTTGTVYSRPWDDKASVTWTVHATAEVSRSTRSGGTLDVGAARGRCTAAVEVEGLYEAFGAVGVEYGPSFRGMQRLHQGEGEVLAEVSLPEEVERAEGYGTHPALLDAAIQSVLGLGTKGLYLPIGIDRFTVFERGAESALVHVRRTGGGGEGETMTVDITLADAQGRVVAEVSGMRVRPAGAEVLAGGAKSEVPRAVYRVEWPESALAEGGTLGGGRWVVVGESGDALAEEVSASLSRRGVESRRVSWSTLGEALPAEHVVCVWSGGGSRVRVERSGGAAFD